MKLKIAVGGDHAGFSYKQQVTDYLNSKGYKVQDYGTHSDQSVDYPDFAHPVSESVETKKHDLGILICGSANGVAMTANKHAGIRAAICWNEELALLARQHNNANILCLPARFISFDEAKAIIDSFLSTDFEGGRHDRRVQKISCC